MARSRATVAIAVILLLLASTTRSGTAAEIEGVHFSDDYKRDDVTRRLHCVGLPRYKVVFKGYVAGLYLGAGLAAENDLADVPKRLEPSHFWSIRGADFGKAGDQIAEQSVDAKTLAALRPRLDQMNSLRRDVRPGDRYSLTYVPGVGTDLALNGSTLGVIDGADFATAYFCIWLGDHPIDVQLFDQLLGCSRRDVEDVHAALPAEHGVP